MFQLQPAPQNILNFETRQLEHQESNENPNFVFCGKNLCQTLLVDCKVIKELKELRLNQISLKLLRGLYMDFSPLLTS